jgi:beta-glucosidase
MRVLISLLGLPLVASNFTYHDCLPASVGAPLKWCDFSLSHEERIAALLGEMTTAEMITLMSPLAIDGSTCNDHTGGVPRLGLSQYMWLTETNTAANSACLSATQCATTFPGPLGMGASFNRTLWYAKGSVIGTELRAFNNIGWHRDAGDPTKDFIGLTGYGPNLNNPRDPRFGRLSELPSEDPYHAGHYAAKEISGAQEEDAKGHPKMITFVKHFTAYSKETNRGHDSYNVSLFNLFDSYLPQYEIAFKEGGAKGGMCSYDAINGAPSCANDFILNEVMRKRWNQPDAFISTDCGAVNNMKGPPAHAPDDAHAGAWVVNNGTDLEMGSDIVLRTLEQALRSKLTTKAVIKTAARRTLVHLFAAGRFDRLEDVEWSRFGRREIASAEHTRIRDDAAAQSFVLLKNEKKVLPLRAGAKVAVIGPQANGHGLFSDYFNDQVCFGSTGGSGGLDCITTIAEAIATANAGGVTTNATGCAMTNTTDRGGLAAAVAVAKAADVVVLALGIDKTVEHEGVR